MSVESLCGEQRESEMSVESRERVLDALLDLIAPHAVKTTTLVLAGLSVNLGGQPNCTVPGGLGNAATGDEHSMGTIMGTAVVLSLPVSTLIALIAAADYYGAYLALNHASLRPA